MKSIWNKINGVRYELNLANIIMVSIDKYESGWAGTIKGYSVFSDHKFYWDRGDAMEAMENLAKHILNVACEALGE